MGIVMIKCPATGRAISTGMEVERASFSRLPVFFGHSFCPICKIDHQWFAAEAWVNDGSIGRARSRRRYS